MATFLVSFGFRHGKPHVEADALVVDVRRCFSRNPYHDKRLRQLRGDHPLVGADVLKTPQFTEHYEALKRSVSDHPGPVYLGCTGGHHRSVYLVERLSTELGVDRLHLNYEDR